MTDDKYALTYELTPRFDGIRREDIPEGHGACDRAILLSCIEHDDGSYSQVLLDVEGATGG